MGDLKCQGGRTPMGGRTHSEEKGMGLRGWEMEERLLKEIIRRGESEE